MPLSYWRDEESGLFFFACEGHVTAGELARFVADRDTKVPEAHDTVIDLSDVIDLDVSAAQIEWLARGRRDCTRLAIVASRPLLVGVSRMFQINADLAGQKGEIRIFSTRKEAVVWLRAARGTSASAGG